MRILHFSLGLPPYRSGGLTVYATDLMKEQVKQGIEVFLLYPGGISLIRGSKIRKRRAVSGINAFEILNPLPVSLYHGISNPDKFISKGDDKIIYAKLLDEVKPDVIHLHTFMGLSISLLQLAKQRKIRIVLTTHDFFGLCLKCTFIDAENHLCDSPAPQRCAWCNQNAKSVAFLRFRNQLCIIGLKNMLHRSYKESKSKSLRIYDEEYYEDEAWKYAELIEYYRKLYSYVDKFHFNSEVTKSVYTRILGKINGETIPITNASIRDNRQKGFYCGKTVKMVFVGHTDAFKGFPLLKSVLLELRQYDWQLDVWGGNEGVDPDCEKIAYRGRYSAKDLEKIYADCTIVTVPSQCYETFSFVTLEALSFGVPVLVSDKVGAKSIVSEYSPSFIFKTKQELKDKLESIMQDRSEVEAFHKEILRKPWHHDMAEHSKYISQEIYSKH